MPAHPAPRGPEEELDLEQEVPVANGELDEEREREGGEGEEETMEESGEDRESEAGSNSEDSEAEEEEEEEEESSEMDDEDYERRKLECLDEMSDLEKQFMELKEKLFRERLSQVKLKLEEVLVGHAGEYKEPLAVLQRNMQLRTEVAGVYKELCLQVIKHKYDCELQGAQQHLESERSLLFDTMKTELLDQIHRLEEERQSRDITSEWWSDELKGKKCRRRSHTARPERRKKATLVSGPYIVYMLKDVDILEDWTAIKKAKAAALPLKKKSENRQQYGARCQGGTLYYEGERFCKGNTILLHVKEDSISQAVITAVSSGEVWLRRTDGSKTKIYVSQLQKGKYTISKA